MSKSNAMRKLAEKDLFSTGEAAAICGVSQQTIIRCFDRGELEGFRIPGSKTRRIPREALVRFVRRHQLMTDPLEKASRRVLIVDDDPHLARRLRTELETDKRFVVKNATNGFDAGVLTVQFSPDLILINVRVVAFDATTLRSGLRTLGKLRRSVMLLAGATLDEQERSMLGERAVDGMIRMPMEVERMAQRIARATPRWEVSNGDGE